MHFISRLKPSWVLLAMASVLLLIAATVPIDGQAGDGVKRFIGRFHILVLHFPVTLLILAPLLSLVAHFKSDSNLKPTIKLIWWAASVTTFVTVSMGMLLAANEGFELDEVRTHMLGGLCVALLTFMLTWLQANKQQKTVHQVSYSVLSGGLVFILFITAHAGGNLVHGEQYLVRFAPDFVADMLVEKQPAKQLVGIDDEHYNNQVKPLLNQYCFGCHGADTQKGGIQLDNLSPDFVKGSDAPNWHAALDMINTGEMPPKKKKQLSDDERRILVEWLTDGITIAKEAKKGKSQKVIRRLSKHQYDNSLKDLTGINANFAYTLPNDPLSEIGFSNNAELLQNSALYLETFESTARAALEKAIDPAEKPKSVHYRMNFGKGIGAGENYNETRGYLAVPLPKEDFFVEVLDENDTAIPADELGELKKYFTVGLRGSYVTSFKVENEGINLYSATAHEESVKGGQLGAFNGPSPNVAMLVKEHFPTEGDFAIRIKASKGNSFEKFRKHAVSTENINPVARLDENNNLIVAKDSVVLNGVAKAKHHEMEKIGEGVNSKFVLKKGAKTGYTFLWAVMPTADMALYEVDVVHPELEKGKVAKIKLRVGNLNIKHDLTHTGRAKVGEKVVSKIGLALTFGKAYDVRLTMLDKNLPSFSDIVLTKLSFDSPQFAQLNEPIKQNIANKDAQPVLTPYLGARTDDGMEYKALSKAQKVTGNSNEGKLYTFVDRLENYPLPNPDAAGDQWISGNLKVGVWNGDMFNKNKPGSVLNVEYIEFEAPYYPEWPSKSHKKIFVNSSLNKTSPEYAKLVIKNFASNAFRRPVTDAEIQPYFEFWQTISPEFERFEDGIKETLVAVLSSTNFLYLAEPKEQVQMADANVTVDDPENQLLALLGIGSVEASENTNNTVTDYALANRLSYFLWNSPPDSELLSLAAEGELKDNIEEQVERMLADTDKLKRFVGVFAREWLRMERLAGQTVDPELFPDFNRFVRSDMTQETQEFLTYLIQQNLTALNVIDADFTMLNQNLAQFYGIEGVMGPEFRKVELANNSQRGGLLGQGAFLTGHADGVHSHPIKRAVWLKSKIIGEEPPPPPPNVPEIDPDTPGFEKLTLKQQLELHRDKEACRDCHAKIDPYGIVFENYDAVGRFRSEYKGNAIDAASVLPDGSEVNGMEQFKEYLFNNKQEKVVNSLTKHLFAYALGKEVSFHDDAEIQNILEQAKEDDYNMQSLLIAIIKSPSFNQG